MNDIFTGSLVPYTGVEVKKFGRNEEEARGQCFQWLSAGVQILRTLINHEENVPPLLGWVVVGHQWDLYMAVGFGDTAKDRIVVFGPVSSCTIDTSNYFGAFKLLRLIERVKEWARDKYWVWYCENVLETLKTGHNNGITLT